MKKTQVTALALAAAVSATALTGCAPKDSDTLININNGEDKLTYGYVNFVCKFFQARSDQMYLGYAGQDYWSTEVSSSTTYEDSTKDNVYDQILTDYVNKKNAKSQGVTLTDADKKAIKAAAKKFMSSNSDKAIKQIGATEQYVEDMLEYETYTVRVQKAIEDKADVKVTAAESDESSVSYVLFSTEDTKNASGDAVKMSDADKEKMKQHAEAVAASSDFDAAVKKEGGKVETHSYVKAADPGSDTALGEDVITAAKKLKDGEISDVIYVKDKGYYVVRMDKVDDKDASKSLKESLTQQKKEEAYNKQVKAWKKKVTFKRNDKLWKQITFFDLFTTASGDASSTSTSAK